MDSEPERTGYREHLLDVIRTGARRTGCGASEPIHVFVNQQRIGQLDGAGTEATLQVRHQTPIESVHLRSEDGVLLGGLSTPEYGFKSSRIALMRDAVELRVQNTAQGGVVSAVFLPAPGLWHRARRAFGRIVGQGAPRPVAAAGSGGRILAVAQILLAIVLIGHFADRITGWTTPATQPLPVIQADIPQAAPLSEVAKLEQQLIELAQTQTKTIETIQTQQQGMAQLQRTMAKLSTAQESVASNVMTVAQELEHSRKGTEHNVDRMTRVLMNKNRSEREQLEAEIHSLLIANDQLSRERTQLEQNYQELKKQLTSSGQDISKTTVPDRDKLVMAQQDAPPQIADAKPIRPQPPFLLWVSFSEGTSQASIDQWVLDMHGRKGAFSEGWQAVEIVPPTEPMERVLDQIKQTKIVKAVKISR
ncbi:MAG: hypothetical protein IT389_03615 [Nitrospira sp.]|nr:hypothetical protein [Nitrospira sp.]